MSLGYPFNISYEVKRSKVKIIGSQSAKNIVQAIECLV